ncbi:hypothetical protein TNCV_3836941 [Trichonephila clavipes]|nr:hypothetical protein TNCV_3836941 [Trichonephila clavipes]
MSSLMQLPDDCMVAAVAEEEIELLPWPACSPNILPIENVWSMLAQLLARDTPPSATPDQLWQYMEAAPKCISKSSLILCRGGYSQKWQLH